MASFKFDPSGTGYGKTLREYQELALGFVWKVGEEVTNSGAVWRAVNERLGEWESISRASVIFFLNDMVDEGVLGFRDATARARTKLSHMKHSLNFISLHNLIFTSP